MIVSLFQCGRCTISIKFVVNNIYTVVFCCKCDQNGITCHVHVSCSRVVVNGITVMGVPYHAFSAGSRVFAFTTILHEILGSSMSEKDDGHSSCKSLLGHSIVLLLSDLTKWHTLGVSTVFRLEFHWGWHSSFPEGLFHSSFPEVQRIQGDHFLLMWRRNPQFQTVVYYEVINESHPRTAEGSGIFIFTTLGRILFYNNWKENFGKFEIHWSEFHEWLKEICTVHSLAPDPQNFSNFLKLWSLCRPWVAKEKTYTWVSVRSKTKT